MTILQTHGVVAGYGGNPVLKGLDLEVEPSAITAVVGPNGAGKSTLLRVLCGQLRPTRGQLHFDGQDVTGISASRLVRQGIAHCPQGRRIFGELTVLENLQLGAYTLPKNEWQTELDRWVELFPVLGERLTQFGGSLSGGEQQMLAIARAMMSRPKLLLLDEPSTGLSPVLTTRMFDAIVEIAAAGVTVVVVEQNLGEALRVASRTLVLADGQLNQVDLSGEQGHQEVLAAYFGSTAGPASPPTALTGP